MASQDMPFSSSPLPPLSLSGCLLELNGKPLFSDVKILDVLSRQIKVGNRDFFLEVRGAWIAGHDSKVFRPYSTARRPYYSLMKSVENN